MRNIFYKLSLILLVLTGISCSTETDNYREPDAVIEGIITSATTGDPVRTEIGDRGTRIKLLEISWSENPTPQYLYSRQDGSYVNNKLFEGTYKIIPEGAFVPLVQTDADGEVIVDNSITTNLKSKETVAIDFQVEPLLEVVWEGEPILNDDGSVTVNFRVTRGTDNPNFQPNMNAVFLFVNNTEYLGDNNWDNRYSYAAVYGGTSGNDHLGEVMSLTTVGGALPSGRTFYLRVGARTDYGLQLYNYNEPIAINIP